MSTDTPVLESDIGVGDYQFGFHDPTDKYVFQSRKGIDRNIVQQISEMKGEPAWMREFRLEALDIFFRKPMPTWGGDMSGLAGMTRAADLGYAPAQTYLGQLYLDGAAGVPADPAKSRQWGRRAAEGGDPRVIVEQRGMKQVTDLGAIEKVVDEIVAANPDKVADAKTNPKAIGWFVGQVMKSSGGKANPEKTRLLLEKLLAG